MIQESFLLGTIFGASVMCVIVGMCMTIEWWLWRVS
jgi:hypothetical protein